MAIILGRSTRRIRPKTATGTRRRHSCRQARGGMTLVEVLVAMAVLLVGIWGVARGFPVLLQAVREEGRRTQMTRLAQATIERLAADPAGIPQLVLGEGSVTPQTMPLDPDSFSFADNPANSRDDVNLVVGERAVVPAVQPGNADVVYPLKIGRADPTMPASVSERAPLVHLLTSPPGTMPSGCFQLAADGSLTLATFANANYAALGWPLAAVEVSYAWRDTASEVHYVQREIVSTAGPLTVVAASLANFSSIVEGTAWGSALMDYLYVGVGVPVGPGEVSLDSTGSLLLFDPADSGRQVQITYWLQVEEYTYNRRAREIWEERVLSATNAVPDPGDPTYAFVIVQLTATGIEGEEVLNALVNPPDGTHVLAIDLVTGATYYENVGIDPAGGIDYDKGRVTMHVPTTALGHRFRFFYRTVDDAMLTVMKAPEWYWPWEIYGGSQPHRAYTVDAISASPYTVLNFTSGVDPVTTNPVSASAGLTVSVDYTYGDPTSPSRVGGELHTINIGTRSITLNQPDVLSIIAVRGVSLKVRGWWRAENGRLRHVDVDTILPPVPAV